MNTYEAYQILSSFVRSTYGFYNEEKSKISILLETNEVEEALKNIQYKLDIVHNKTFYLALIRNTSKIVIFYSSPNDFEGKRVIAVFDEMKYDSITKRFEYEKYHIAVENDLNDTINDLKNIITG